MTTVKNQSFKQIQAGRNVAGRDIYENSINLSVPQLSRIALLLQKLNDGDHGAELSSYQADLATWAEPSRSSTILGVENKLNAADRQDEVALAEQDKERIYAALTEMQFSETYQRICIELMGDVLQRFNSLVKPAILEGKKRSEVDVLVHEHVIKAVYERVEMCGVDNSITWATIRGMLYFLTGNCHVNWTP